MWTVKSKNWKWEGCKFEIQKLQRKKKKRKRNLSANLNQWNQDGFKWQNWGSEMLWYAHKAYEFIMWYRETIRYERRHCSPHISLFSHNSSVKPLLLIKSHEYPWCGKYSIMTWKKEWAVVQKKYVLQAHLDPLYHKLIFFFFIVEIKGTARSYWILKLFSWRR